MLGRAGPAALPIRRDHHRRHRGWPARRPHRPARASCSANSTFSPSWTATSSCAGGQPAGRDAAGRSRAPTGSVGRWRSIRTVNSLSRSLSPISLGVRPSCPPRHPWPDPTSRRAAASARPPTGSPRPSGRPATPGGRRPYPAPGGGAACRGAAPASPAPRATGPDRAGGCRAGRIHPDRAAPQLAPVARLQLLLYHQHVPAAQVLHPVIETARPSVSGPHIALAVPVTRHLNLSVGIQRSPAHPYRPALPPGHLPPCRQGPGALEASATGRNRGTPGKPGLGPRLVHMAFPTLPLPGDRGVGGVSPSPRAAGQAARLGARWPIRSVRVDPSQRRPCFLTAVQVTGRATHR